jgi:repressor LexA
MFMPLTPKEIRFLEYLEQFIGQRGFSPSYQEICDHFEFASFNSVQNYLKQLSRKNYLKLEAHQKRAIQLCYSLDRSPLRVQQSFNKNTSSKKNQESASSFFKLPLLGTVAAGRPLEHLEHGEFVEVPASMAVHPEKTYALRVSGESMKDEGILDGDLILVLDTPSASSGDLVVAKLEEEATVKRIYFHTKKNNGPIELRPSNSQFQSLWLEPHQVQVRGRVQGLIRSY